MVLLEVIVAVVVVVVVVVAAIFSARECLFPPKILTSSLVLVSAEIWMNGMNEWNEWNEEWIDNRDDGLDF